MARPTRIIIHQHALMHNIQRVKNLAPGKAIVAMVKANAYGCGWPWVLPVLDGQVDAFGVASLEEALKVKALGVHTPCIIFQGAFDSEEYPIMAKHHFSTVIHHEKQIEWLVNTPLTKPLKIWVKVNTGMNRLGFDKAQLKAVVKALKNCPHIAPNWCLMTHLACADEQGHLANKSQLDVFQSLDRKDFSYLSIANSAGIISMPESHADIVRPGIMLYGVSPYSDKTGMELGLLPVLQFVSAIHGIQTIQPSMSVGYGGTWKATKPTVVGIVAAGYGDGYPRHVSKEAYVWIHNHPAPIIGRVSMDTLAVDITHIPQTKLGDTVELWGKNIPVEKVALWAQTIGYELLTQITDRPKYWLM